MTELKNIAEEKLRLLAGYKQSGKSKPSHEEIANLYKAYLEEETHKNPRKMIVKIRKEFASFFGKGTTWAGNYAYLANLLPEFLARVGVPGSQGIPLNAGIKLAQTPPSLQKEVLKRAEAMACGNTQYLYSKLMEISEGEKRESTLRQLYVALQYSMSEDGIKGIIEMLPERETSSLLVRLDSLRLYVVEAERKRQRNKQDSLMPESSQTSTLKVVAVPKATPIPTPKPVPAVTVAQNPPPTPAPAPSQKPVEDKVKEKRVKKPSKFAITGRPSWPSCTADQNTLEERAEQPDDQKWVSRKIKGKSY